MSDTDKLIAAALAGARIHEKYFAGSLTITQKSSEFDLVTQADTEGEAAILSLLKQSFPEVAIVSEESGQISGKNDRRLIVDPLDGSFNYVLGSTQFSISIALQENNSTIAAVVYQPVLRRCYSAARGQGAFLNGQPITVTKSTAPSAAVVTYTCDYQTPDERILNIEALLYKNFARIMNNWSPALDLCSLAAGRTHAHFNDGNSLYDFAAGKLIAREAGALITKLDGSPDDDDNNNLFIAAANQTLLNLLMEAQRVASH